MTNVSGGERTLRSLVPHFCSAAQQVYDNWVQDAQGFSHRYGSAGICDDISRAFCRVMRAAGIKDALGAHDGTHTVTVCSFPDGVAYSVDIPFSAYEIPLLNEARWQKIHGVVFKPSDVVIQRI